MPPTPAPLAEADGRTIYVRAALAAVCAAALFALSPLSALCLVAMSLITWRGVAGLEGAERRWVGGALVVGTVLRVLCVLGIFLLTKPQDQFNVLFGDGRFAVDRSIWILNKVSGVAISPFYWMRVSQNYGDVQYHYALAVVQWFAGASPFSLGLINVACFEAFAIVLHRLVRPAFGATAAATTLVLLVFWPTLFVWSFSMLKESLQFGLAIGATACTVWCLRTDRVALRIAYAAGALVSLIALSELRPGSSLMAGGAIVFGLIAYVATRHAWATAATAVVAALFLAAAASSPSVQAMTVSQTQLALVRHIGHVKSTGISYKAADERFYRGERLVPYTMTGREGVRFLTLSAIYFFIAPLPQHIASVTGTLFIPLHLVWCGLLVLALFGVPDALRRDALVTWISIGYVLAGLVTIAPNSGNIGTLIRHRDMVVPFVIGLGSVGLMRLMAVVSRQSESDLHYATH